MKRIDDALRAAIVKSGETHYRIGKDCGLKPDILADFVAGKRGIRLESAARIAQRLGLQLIREKYARIPSIEAETARILMDADLYIDSIGLRDRGWSAELMKEFLRPHFAVKPHEGYRMRWHIYELRTVQDIEDNPKFIAAQEKRGKGVRRESPHK